MSEEGRVSCVETISLEEGAMCVFRTTTKELLTALDSVRTTLHLPQEVLFSVLLDQLTAKHLVYQRTICPHTVGDRRCSFKNGHVGKHVSVLG